MLARSKAFYEDILGLVPNGNYERWQGYEVAGRSGFGINEDPSLCRSRCLDIIHFIVTDIDMMCERLEDAVRVEFTLQVVLWGARKVAILDPDGMRMGFLE
ncbi:MAG: VOC family protein [Candidatus Bipolaricaulota bacterium]